MNTKPWWESKVNWVQIIGMLAQMAAWWGLSVTPETQAAVASFLAAGQALLTIVLKTWFSAVPVANSLR